MKPRITTTDRVLSFIAMMVLAGILFALTACSQAPTVAKKAEPAWPEPVRYEPVHFDMDPENPHLLKTTVESYKNLDVMIRDMLRYIDQSNTIICFYREHKDTDIRCQ